jgi:Raf kinase inhibitor-like YbhB/YbcL family protein
MPPEPEEMVITSGAFEEDGIIPDVYSCDGQGKSPELNWMGVPEGTQSLALILDDPDAPGGTFTHWVIFNIPADATGLEENVPKTSTLASGAAQGRNDFGQTGYSGPCPPTGQSHRYFITLYALDTTLDLAGGTSKAQVLAAMEGHILAEAEIMGNFQS